MPDEKERVATLNAAKAIKEEKIRETERRRRERENFLKPDYTLNDMFRQSDTRVYWMKSHKFSKSHPGLHTWTHPETASKYLSRFKYNKKKCDYYEDMFSAAAQAGDEKQMDEYKEEADKYLTKCLHAHYVIGLLHRQFLESSVMIPEEDDVNDI